MRKPHPQQAYFDFELNLAHYIVDEKLHGPLRKQRNPFNMGDNAVCIKLVSGYNIYPGDTAICGPYNERLIRFGNEICSASHFKALSECYLPTSFV